MTPQSETKSAQIREFVANCGPVTPRQLGAVFPKYWNLCSTMLRRKILRRDDLGRYVIGRPPLPTHGQRVDPGPRLARERERLRRKTAEKTAQRQAQRLALGLVGPVVRARRAAECGTRKAERAQAAQAVRNREVGIRAFVPASPKVETVADFLARGGQVQRLGNGDVSPASRFERLQVRT